MVNRMHTIMLLCAVGRTLSTVSTCHREGAGDDEETFGGSFFQRGSKVGSKLHLEEERGRLNVKRVMAAAMELAKSQITPEVNSTIHELITKIETDIEENIKADKNATQNAVDSAVQACGEAARPIPDWKRSADFADQEYNTCMVAKNDMDTAHSECIAAQQSLDTTKRTKCAEQEAKQVETYTFPNHLHCDFSTGQCGALVDALRATFEEWLTTAQILSNQAHSDYTSAKAECDEATSNLAEKTAECQEKKTLRDNKVLECEHLDAKRKVRICSFGDKLQMKCDKKDQYTQLATKVDEVNASHQHSHRDRKSEWTTTQLIKCALMRHTQGHEFNSTSINHCTKTEAEATADFEEKVGSIDLKESEYLSHLGEHFKCDASMRNITFGTDNTQTFDVTLSNPPFSFCAISTNTCGENFNCVVGGVERTKKPAVTTCQLESGCTTADCCEDAPTPVPTPAPTQLATNWTRVVEVELGTTGWQVPTKLNGKVYVISRTAIHKIDDQGIASLLPVTGTFPEANWGLDVDLRCSTDTNDERLFCLMFSAPKGFFLDGVSDTVQVVQMPHAWGQNTFYLNGKFYIMAEERGGSVNVVFDPADKSLRELTIPDEVFNGQPGSGGYNRLYGAENGFIVALPNHADIFYAIALEVATETFHYVECCSNVTFCRQMQHRQAYGFGKALTGSGKVYAMPHASVPYGLVFDTTTKECSSVPLSWPEYNHDPNFWDFDIFAFMYYNEGRLKVNGKYYFVPVGHGLLANLKVHVFDPAVGFSSLREISNKTIQDVSPDIHCYQARAVIQGSKIFVRCHQRYRHIWSIDTETESVDSVCQVTNKDGIVVDWGIIGDHIIFPPAEPGDAIEVWDETAKELSEVPFPEAEPKYYQSITAHNKLYIGAFTGSQLAIYG